MPTAMSPAVEALRTLALTVDCPYCLARRGYNCKIVKLRFFEYPRLTRRPHQDRIRRAQEAQPKKRARKDQAQRDAKFDRMVERRKGTA
jgi:hypothetical protein